MNIKFFGILIIFFFIMGKSINAQTVTITDNETDQPIELVTIFSAEADAFVITNAKGQADLSDFKEADDIVIQSLSYETVMLSYQKLGSLSFKIGMTPSSIVLDDVIVSATRWNQVARDIPIQIRSLSPGEVSLQNPQTAADMLNISGKVYIQKSQQGGGSPMIRGFATNRLLYSVDGVRMNTAIFRGGNIQNVISLDPFAIEQTEVLFGPGSVIYGSDAIGGVMSFRTLTPQFSLDDNFDSNLRFVARYSTANNEKTGHAQFNVGWKKIALVTSLSANDYGDLKMGSFGPEDYLRNNYAENQKGKDTLVANEDPRIQRPSGYSQLNFMQKVRYKPNKNWDFTYGFHHSETSDYARYDRLLQIKDNGNPRYAEWYYGPQKWQMHNLNVANNHQTKLFDHSSLRFAIQYFEESRITRSYGAMLKFGNRYRTEKVDAYSLNLDFVKSTSSKNKVYYGFEWIWNKVNSSGYRYNFSLSGARESIAPRYPNSDWYSYGVYLTDHYQVSESIFLQVGIRYNIFQLNSKFFQSYYSLPYSTVQLKNDALTGSFGAVFRPDHNWVISSNLSTAFRAPNVDDMGKVFDSEPGAVVIPNPDLKSEYAYNADLNITRIFNKKVKIDLTGYYTILQNAMVRRDFQLNGMDSIEYDGVLSKVQAIQNAAVARVYGIQAGLEVKLPAGLGFSSNLNFQQGKEELDDGSLSPSRHAAPFFGNASLNYRSKKFKIEFYAVFNDKKEFDELPESERSKDYIYALDENGNPYSPGWFTLNIKAQYRINANNDLNIGVENILDKRYLPYSSGIAAPGRNLVISFRYGY